MSGGLFAYVRSRLSAAPRSLLLPRKLTLIVPHDTNATDKVQQLVQVQERGALTTLHVLNPTAPARPSGRPLLPKADDEGADWWNWGWFSHTGFLSARPFGFSETRRVFVLQRGPEELSPGPRCPRRFGFCLIGRGRTPTAALRPGPGAVARQRQATAGASRLGWFHRSPARRPWRPVASPGTRRIWST